MRPQVAGIGPTESETGRSRTGQGRARFCGRGRGEGLATTSASETGRSRTQKGTGRQRTPGDRRRAGFRPDSATEADAGTKVREKEGDGHDCETERKVQAKRRM